MTHGVAVREPQTLVALLPSAMHVNYPAAA